MMNSGGAVAVETRNVDPAELRASKSCFACGRTADNRVRPPVASGVRLDWNVVVPACDRCAIEVGRLSGLPFYMRRLTCLGLPPAVALFGTFVLPTQGVMPSHGPLVTAVVFVGVWVGLVVAIRRHRRRRTQSARALVVGVRDGTLDL